MPAPERHVVRPRTWKLLLYLLGTLVFVAIGVLMILDGGVVLILLGVMEIVFFGGGMLMAVLVTLRRGGGLSQLALTPDGIELAAGGRIPWDDVAEVGVTTVPTKLVWMRLRGYERYLASIPSERRREAGLFVRFMKPFAHLFRFIPAMRRYAEQVRDAEDMLVWNRREFGYDVGFSPALLDRSPERFVELLERYRQRFSGAG